MWQRNKYYILIAIIIGLLLLIESGKPKKINWFESYSKYDKIPYGNYILYHELQDIFGESIITSAKTIKETCTENSEFTNYVFINNSFNIDDRELFPLLDFASAGKNIFIAAHSFNQKLLDTLNLKMGFMFNNLLVDTTSVLSVYKPNSRYRYSFTRTFYSNYFSDIGNAIALGSVKDSLVNFVKVSFGDGNFFINVNPLLFTNIHMLKNNNNRYVSDVLSHLPNSSVIWDEYYKNRKNAIAQSPLQGIYSRKGLRQALYMGLLSLLIYMLFSSKRKQRIIPELDPKINSTLDFTTTIGQLYYDEHNNQDIGKKRIDYFLADIRKKFNISTTKLNDEFCKKLSLVSGVEQKNIKDLIRNFNIIKGVPEVGNEKIIEQDKLIENFYKNLK